MKALQLAQENLGSDGNILYLDCGDGYLGVCICQNSKNCYHLNGYSLLFIIITHKVRTHTYEITLIPTEKLKLKIFSILRVSDDAK